MKQRTNIDPRHWKRNRRDDARKQDKVDGFLPWSIANSSDVVWAQMIFCSLSHLFSLFFYWFGNNWPTWWMMASVWMYLSITEIDMTRHILSSARRKRKRWWSDVISSQTDVKCKRIREGKKRNHEKPDMEEKKAGRQLRVKREVRRKKNKKTHVWPTASLCCLIFPLVASLLPLLTS